MQKKYIPGMKVQETEEGLPTRILWVGLLTNEKVQDLRFAWKEQTRDFLGHEIVITADDDGYTFWCPLEEFNRELDTQDLATRLLLEAIS